MSTGKEDAQGCIVLGVLIFSLASREFKEGDSRAEAVELIKLVRERLAISEFKLVDYVELAQQILEEPGTVKQSLSILLEILPKDKHQLVIEALQENNIAATGDRRALLDRAIALWG